LHAAAGELIGRITHELGDMDGANQSLVDELIAGE
jgi:hypothetical protein